MRGRGKKQNRGQRKRKHTISPSQRTLFDFVEKKIKAENQPQEESQEFSDSSQDENIMIKYEKHLNELIQNHRLMEIVNFFQMGEQMQIQITRIQMKHLYYSVQQQIVAEFGAPISQSLFPAFIFQESSESSVGSFNSSQHPNYDF